MLLHGLDEQAGGGSGPRAEIFGSHLTHLVKCHSIGLTGLSLGSNNLEVKGKRLFCTDLQPMEGMDVSHSNKERRFIYVLSSAFLLPLLPLAVSRDHQQRP
jgi:hypothetical protein